MTLILFLALLGLQPQRHVKSAEPSGSCSDALAYQVMLDRAGFSPGEIDGTFGPNLQRALAAFQSSAKLPSSGRPDCSTWKELNAVTGGQVLTEYTVTAEDVAGTYLGQHLPADLAKQAELPALSYESVAEAIAERFHASPSLLARLNGGLQMKEGVALKVPAVTPFDPSIKPVADAAVGGTSVEVSRHDSTLRVVRADGTLALLAPVSSGSEHDPLPVGTWKVTGTAWMPPFHYNPELFWDAEQGDSRATLKPGPNNPVGVVWIDINVPHYGMHGTPTPNLVGHAQSHGCVRLTNWDAARLASLVKPGTRVVFSE